VAAGALTLPGPGHYPPVSRHALSTSLWPLQSCSAVQQTLSTIRVNYWDSAADRLGVLFFDIVLQFPLGHSSSSLLQPDSKLLPLLDRHHDAYDNRDAPPIHFISPDNVPAVDSFITLAASSGKRNVTVWRRPSVRLSPRHIHGDLPEGSMQRGQRTFRPDLYSLLMVSAGLQETCSALYMHTRWQIGVQRKPYVV